MYKNNIIELFPEEEKKKMYEAMDKGIPVLYTRNRRGIPGESYVYEAKELYIEVVIAPKQSILCYTDFEIRPLEKMFYEHFNKDDTAKFKSYYEQNGMEKFLKAITCISNKFPGQYADSDIADFIINDGGKDCS